MEFKCVLFALCEGTHFLYFEQRKNVKKKCGKTRNFH